MSVALQNVDIYQEMNAHILNRKKNNYINQLNLLEHTKSLKRDVLYKPSIFIRVQKFGY